MVGRQGEEASLGLLEQGVALAVVAGAVASEVPEAPEAPRPYFSQNFSRVTELLTEVFCYQKLW